MNLTEALAKLKEAEIPCTESNKKNFDYFIADNQDDIPISDEENEGIQAFGIHMTEKDIIEFAETL